MNYIKNNDILLLVNMSSIEQSTGFLVVRTARSIIKSLYYNLTTFGITSSQYHVLNVLNDKDGQALSMPPDQKNYAIWVMAIKLKNCSE